MTALDVDIAPLKFVDLRGYRMAYREWGDPAAAAIVLIHGITSSSLSWIRLAPRLAAHRHVIAVDLKGHGDSDRPPAGYRLADQADEIAGLCSTLQLANVSVMGHSWGGGIALLLAATGGVPIQRLVLEDPGVGQRGEMTPEQQLTRQQMTDFYIGSVGLSREEAEERVRPNLALGWTEQDVAGKVDAAMKSSRASVAAVFAENRRWNLVDRFSDLRCPTLLVRAEVERGGIVGADAVGVAQANPLVRVVTVPDADHNIHRGKFDAFMAEVEPFLNA